MSVGGRERRAAPRIDGTGASQALHVAAERLPELRAIHPERSLEPPIERPRPGRARGHGRTRSPSSSAAVCCRWVRRPPATLARSLAIDTGTRTRRSSRSKRTASCCADASAPGHRTLEWCDRALLARIHRYTLNRLRAEIEPVSPADFMRFLFGWQHVDPPIG